MNKFNLSLLLISLISQSMFASGIMFFPRVPDWNLPVVEQGDSAPSSPKEAAAIKRQRSDGVLQPLSTNQGFDGQHDGDDDDDDRQPRRDPSFKAKTCQGASWSIEHTLHMMHLHIQGLEGIRDYGFDLWERRTMATRAMRNIEGMYHDLLVRNPTQRERIIRLAHPLMTRMRTAMMYYRAIFETEPVLTQEPRDRSGSTVVVTREVSGFTDDCSRTRSFSLGGEYVDGEWVDRQEN